MLEQATEDDHLALLAYLNSSTACFWMKQVFFDKGNQGGERGRPSELFEAYFEFDGTKLNALPIPAGFDDMKDELAALARELSAAGLRHAQLLDLSTIFADSTSVAMLRERLEQRVTLVRNVQGQMRALQEQLDWTIYRVFKFTTHAPRAFEHRAPGARLCDHVWAKNALSAETSVRYFTLCHVGDPLEIASANWANEWGLTAEEEAMLASPVLQIMETPAYKRTYKDSFGLMDIRRHGQAYLDMVLEQIISRHVDVMTLHDWAAELRRRAAPALEWCEELDPDILRGLLAEASIPFAAATRY